MHTARDMEDFTNFGGQLDAAGVYKFPALYHKDAHGKTRVWKMTVRLLKKPEGDAVPTVMIPIMTDYLKTAPLPANAVAQYWSASGMVDGKIIAHAPSYGVPTNVGRKNERNTLKSALVKARALYLKEVDKGRLPLEQFNNPVKPRHPRIRPMLAHNYNDVELQYPLYIQPKLDGIRAMVYLDKPADATTVPTAANVVIYARSLKDITGFDSLRRELLPHFIKHYNSAADESLYLDGEFYEHGKDLRYITGFVRNINRNNLGDEGVKLHVFDAFYPSKLSMPYSERLGLVRGFFADKPRDAWKMISEVPTVLVKNEKDGDLEYKRLISLKYEGAMYKTASAPYLGSANESTSEQRSYDMLRRKNSFRDEFEIVGYTQGERGKDIGAIIWQCKAKKSDKIFNVTPKDMTYEERADLFKQASKSFKEKFAGRMMTVEYQDLSSDGVPQRAKAIWFREDE